MGGVVSSLLASTVVFFFACVAKYSSKHCGGLGGSMQKNYFCDDYTRYRKKIMYHIHEQNAGNLTTAILQIQ